MLLEGLELLLHCFGAAVAGGVNAEVLQPRQCCYSLKMGFKVRAWLGEVQGFEVGHKGDVQENLLELRFSRAGVGPAVSGRGIDRLFAYSTLKSMKGGNRVHTSPSIKG